MAKEIDYYKLLGVSIFASDEEVRNAYLSKIKEYHPDTYKGSKREAENITANLNLAYSTLNDKDKKFVYDKQFGFDKMRENFLKQKEKEDRFAQKKNRKNKNIDPSTGDYAYEKQKNKSTKKQKEFNDQTAQQDKKIKTNIFTKEPKKDVKRVKKHVLTPEQQSLRKERIVLDFVIIALLIIVILLIIFR